jgi:hypothetical protein
MLGSSPRTSELWKDCQTQSTSGTQMIRCVLLTASSPFCRQYTHFITRGAPLQFPCSFALPLLESSCEIYTCLSLLFLYNTYSLYRF